jgi:hypothetical protein
MTIINLETLESLLEHNSKVAVDIYEKDKNLTAMIIGYSPDNKTRYCFPGIFRDQDEKRKFLQLVTIGFAALGVDKYAVVCESWGVEDSDLDRQKYPDFSKHPNRVECLMIIAVNKLGNRVRMYKIKNKKLEFWYDDGNTVAGIFVELLPKVKIPKAIGKSILDLLKRSGVTAEEL